MVVFGLVQHYTGSTDSMMVTSKRVVVEGFNDRVENILQEPDGAQWLVTPNGFVCLLMAR
jgi:hypothetical protein